MFTGSTPAVHPAAVMLGNQRSYQLKEGANMRVEGLFRDAQDTTAVPAGTVIFREGETGQEMYGIVEGQIQLETAGSPVATLGPNDVFGEMAIIDHEVRMATATAATDAVLAVVDRRRFLWLVHETPTFALQVMHTMAERLRHAEPVGAGGLEPPSSAV